MLARNASVYLLGILPDSSFGLELWQNNQRKTLLQAELLPGESAEPLLFWQTMSEAMPENTFWKQAADLLNSSGQWPTRGEKYRLYHGLRDFAPNRLRLWSFADGTLFAHNTSPHYLPARMHIPKKVVSAESMTFYPFQPVQISAEDEGKSRLDGRIPSYGTIVLKLKYESE